jgi:hypothetical protein
LARQPIRTCWRPSDRPQGDGERVEETGPPVRDVRGPDHVVGALVEGAWEILPASGGPGCVRRGRSVGRRRTQKFDDTISSSSYDASSASSFITSVVFHPRIVCGTLFVLTTRRLLLLLPLPGGPGPERIRARQLSLVVRILVLLFIGHVISTSYMTSLKSAFFMRHVDVIRT